MPVENAGYYQYNPTTKVINDTPNSNASYKCAKVTCTAGDVYEITGRSNGNAARLYAFTDANYNVLVCSVKDATLQNEIVTAPAGTAYLYLNNYQSSVTVKKGIAIDDHVDGNTSKIGALALDVFRNFNSAGFGITWEQGAFNVNTGQGITSNASIRTNEGIDVAEARIKRVYVSDTSYKLRLYAWDRTTKTYAGMWNGTQIVPYSASYFFKYTDIDTSSLDNYIIRFTLSKASEDSITIDDANVVVFNAPRFQTIETNAPQDYMGREFCVFDKVLCIGDSLIAGGANHPSGITSDPNNATRTVNTGMYSIPTFLEKMYGIQAENWGISGATTKSWYESKIASEPDWSGFDAALIYIGSNDYTYCTVGGMTPEEGAAQSETYINNIITKLKQSNAGIRIFLCTLNPSASTGEYAQYRLPLLEKIRSIAASDDSVFLIDMNTYGTLVPYSPYHNGHPTAIGYQLMAKEMGSIASYIISHEPSSFRWIRWIGTEYAVVDESDVGSDEPDVG